MKSIDYKDFKKTLLKEDIIEDGLVITKDGQDKFIILDLEKFEDMTMQLEERLSSFKTMPQIKVINEDDISLSPEEYEKVKKELNDAFDATFKPKVEKMS